MPSSPETTVTRGPAVAAWSPPELDGPAAAALLASSSPSSSPQFEPRPDLDRRRDTDRRRSGGRRIAGDRRATGGEHQGQDATWFELSAQAGIPDELLAEARSAAEAAGYVAGWNRGNASARDEAETRARRDRAAAEQQVAAAIGELEIAARTLRTAAVGLDARAVDGAAEVEDLVVTAAFRIAEQLVGCALGDDERRGRAAVARALALAPSDEAVTVAVSPVDHDLLAVRPMDLGPGVVLVADPTLRPGDAYARAGATTIDARIHTGLERVRALLRTDAPVESLAGALS